MENPYETDRLLGEYLHFHYGNENEVMPWSFGPKNGLNFAIRSVSELLDHASLNVSQKTSALDVGCAVGRSTFELAKHCDEVRGCDLSNAFIEAAELILSGGGLSYDYLEEGDSYNNSTITFNNQNENISFFVADACSLSTDLPAFDVVHAANLICRLPNPLDFINRLPELVIKGGQLLLATPFTWLEEFTPRENWIGSGNSEEKLAELLHPYFKLERKVELPFLIREHRRKYQYSVSFGSRWRRV